MKALPVAPSHILTVTALLALVGAPSSAEAGNPDTIDAETPDPLVYMGEQVAPCGWPTAAAAVSGGGLCTASLVHPRVVILAAHCGGGNKTIRFGENAFSGGQAVNASCTTNPEYSGNQGNDWAFCVLDQPVDNIPIAPILFGCELDTLVPQAEVAIVGFGKNTANGGSGIKRFGYTTLQAVNFEGNTTALGGGGEPSVCPGDSGGPALIKGDDGIWRVFGIASTVQLIGDSDCGGLATHSLAAGAVGWIEEASGYDITPCHNSDGSWAPSPDCTGFFGSANNSYGNWGNWCAGTPASPPPMTCGPAAGTDPEDNPPSVSITSPAEDFESADIPTKFDVAISASDDSGYVSTWLRINDEDFLNVVDNEPPYEVKNVTLPEGGYEIRAIAEDFWGNQAESSPLIVIVGDSEPPTTGDGDGDGGGSEGGTGLTAGLSGGLDGGFDDGGGSGCACSSSDDERAPFGVGALALLALAFVRRRR